MLMCFWLVTLNTMINAMFLLDIDVAYDAFFNVFVYLIYKSEYGEQIKCIEYVGNS